MFGIMGNFLRRLGRNTAGNTLAIMGAAFFPLAGLVGGGVDMTRIYITKTRLQQACDAGALAGRKTMGAGAWTITGANNPRDNAYQFFDTNFKEGDFGTGSSTRQFTHNDGTVTGTASAVVPMTLMRIFGQTESTVSVECTAKMEIPNTDVMFVLDVTASMNCAPGCAYNATEQATAKIKDLRKAVNCFYEALLKVNTAATCGNDPSGTSYDGTAQIRLGFVPYAVNVNVGKLLPNEYMSDTWAYDTRRPNFVTRYSWQTQGAVGTPSMTGSWSAAPSDINNQSKYSSWTDRPTSPANVNINGTNYAVRRDASESTCNGYNTIGPSGNKMLAYTDAAGTAGTAYQNGEAAPVHPANTRSLPYRQDRTNTVTGYKYRFVSGQSGSNRCRLQSGTRTYTAQRTGSATQQVTWTSHQVWDNTWTYSEQTLDVSGLKAGGSNWNGSVALTHTEANRFTGTTTGPTVKLSGETSNTTLAIPGNLTVGWDGCIEERKTYQNTNQNPAGDWNTIPDTALDMQVNLVPSDDVSGSKWGPLLPNAFWGRYTGTNTSNRTRNTVTTSTNLDRNLTGGISTGYYCPNEARKLTEYKTPGSLESYIAGLQSNAIGTYHDIGMLWGARLLSPTGIFASENAFTAKGGSIERHMIFMTDGDAVPYANNLDAYGSSFWARRQTSYEPSTTHLTALINSRTEAICEVVKSMNIKLWVISYGGGVNAANEARLEECASPGHYYSASDGAALIARFQQIASEIADLRLTK